MLLKILQRTNRIFKFAKKKLPKISETERIALNSGTIGFDKNIFSGNPSIKLLKKYSVKMSTQEADYIKELDDICAKINDYKIVNSGKIPDSIWDMLTNKKIFSMIIPEEYGGLGFKTHARSQIVQKLVSVSGSVGVISMVPNSLGPGELLMKYGTKEQKKYYLPLLSSGQIPCFGLTSWAAGSDAAGSMIDCGTVVKENNNIGIRLTANKRYITLAPVANIIGIAFKLSDPNGLLTSGKTGITLALLEKKDYPDITGDKHNPLDIPFPNGTINEKYLI